MVLTLVPLQDRAVLSVEGTDAASFLQGLITNDIAKATETQAIWAALLSPQGKFLFDFFIRRTSSGYLLETEAARLDELLKKMNVYKLRSNVQLRRAEEWQVYALLNDAAHLPCRLAEASGAAKHENGIHYYVDPRAVALGVRLLAPTPLTLSLPHIEGSIENYERLRLMHGIPEGSKDAQIDRTVILENGYDVLGAIDFQKGCYVGQEVIARTTYRGSLRKRLYCVESAHLPPSGAIIRAGELEIGTMRSSLGQHGLAVLRSEEVAQAERQRHAITAEGNVLHVTSPAWHAISH